MPLRVLIADDHTLFRAGLSALLSSIPDLKVVGEAADGEQTLRLTDELHPDIVLMDISMPVASGIKATTELRKMHPDVHVLVITFRDEEPLLREAIQAGAAGYLLKTASPDEFLGAIQTVLHGGLYVDPAMIRSWLKETPGTTGSQLGQAHGLTKRQVEVLHLIALGYTTPQIAESLFISVRTVEYHRRSIAQKLGLQTRAELVRFALAHGLLQNQDTEE